MQGSQLKQEPGSQLKQGPGTPETQGPPLQSVRGALHLPPPKRGWASEVWVLVSGARSICDVLCDGLWHYAMDFRH
jgi:hypothetical protein